MQPLIRSARPFLSIVVGMVLLACADRAGAQGEPVNGIRPAELRVHALVGGTVVVRPGETIEEATIIVRDGMIEAVGADIPVPSEARVWDMSGHHVHAGLIDAAVMMDVERADDGTARHWNDKVRPEVRVAGAPMPVASLRKSLRELGFTAAAVYPSSGIFRGSGAVLALVDDPKHAVVYDDRAAMAMSFERGGGWSNPSYPGSLMGAIALVRQTLLDAQWHAACRDLYADHPTGNEPPAPNAALDALAPVVGAGQRVLWDVSDEHNALRAGRIVEEFDLDLVLLGSGMEFRRLDEIAALGAPVIVTLKVPKRPNVTTVSAADRTSLRDMATWEQAPTNARRLVDAGVTVALSTHRLKGRREFPAAVRAAIRHGLTEDDALASLTTVPAALLGLDDVMGTIETGKVANFVVTDAPLFEKKRKVMSTWVNGRRHEIETPPDLDIELKGLLTTADGRSLPVELKTEKPAATFHVGGKTVKAKKVTVMKDLVSIVVDGQPFEVEGWVRLSGAATNGSITGTGVLPDGSRFAFGVEDDEEAFEAATRTDVEEEDGADPPDAEEDDDAADDDGGLSGTWSLSSTSPQSGRGGGMSLELALDDDGTVSGHLLMRGESVPLSEGLFDRRTAQFTAEFDTPGGGTSSLVATLADDTLTGTVRNELFEMEWTGTREDDDEDDEDFEMPPDALVVPLGAYGLAARPASETVFVTNAVIWTCGPDGIIENGSMLVRDGVIEAVGTGLAAPEGATIVDADGRHVTPGLLDCHSHTGISSGVNEFAQTNTAEVRIGDVVNPDDVNWYRQLAGGLTAANLLHGSANPIGGQNQVVKLRWGGGAEDFKLKSAIGGIKFALGENVKRSENRYPNTRMGVETFIRDAFTAARAYADERDRYEALPDDERSRRYPPRRDLELDALVEILEGERLVHCHSYRQDEILMLIRIADDFGFTIGTFQHVLEGYKVAEAIAAHGGGASCFSDWWAYKMEVMDAIPFAGALMHDVGVLVSFNSDSGELARRMNTEAAKAVRYGGLEPHEALKFVTINPAKQLGVDDRIGSLEVGKDGDFAIWTEDPLSTYARCEQTWIEGWCAFDVERDRAMRTLIESERQRLIQKVLAAAHGDAPSAAGEETGDAESPSTMPTGRAAQIDARTYAWMLERVRLGHDPFEIRPGDCGCGHAGHVH